MELHGGKGKTFKKAMLRKMIDFFLHLNFDYIGLIK